MLGWLLWLATGAVAEAPRALDGRLTLGCFAAEPQVVTPVGIAVDQRGRVFVVESHTHFRPKGYEGPPADRIRVLEDTDGDDRADRITTFFEGTTHTMGLGFAPDGALWVATRSEVFRLVDANGDGRSDGRTTMARLVTEGDYPHNGLSGVAFDAAGHAYFGMGENLGVDYELVGADGTILRGGGEGGGVYRIGPDGSGLTRIATGFWNPFHLAFDAFGRLYAVDNDPDSRPPCRLLHIVAGGDYGYRFRNGRRGVHPFTAWNGELPGTLPMLAGTGEAPSGLVVYEADQFPADYRGTILVTSWGDHRIERHTLVRRGASFGSEVKVIASGAEDFRPVGIAVAPDGSVYLSDWVDKSYELHGKGRIWHLQAVNPPDPPPLGTPEYRLRAADRAVRERAAEDLASAGIRGHNALESAATSGPDPRVRATALDTLLTLREASATVIASAMADPSEDVRALAVRRAEPGQIPRATLEPPLATPEILAEAMRRDAPAVREPELISALASDDPFLRQAARVALARRPSPRPESLAESATPAVREAAVLLLRESGRPEAREALPRLLGDPDPRVRFLAVQWVGEERLERFAPALRQALATDAAAGPLFGAYLAALERLAGTRRKATDELGDQDYLATLLEDERLGPDALARALRGLRPDHPALKLSRLASYLASPDESLRLEAVRTLRERPASEAAPLLSALARDANAPAMLRAEAIVGLDGADPEVRDFLLQLAANTPGPVRLEAIRSLRGAKLDPEHESALRRTVADDPAALELLATRAADDRQPEAPPAGDLEGWLCYLEGPADAAAGARVFFHPKGPGCYRCHAIDGRGGAAGPDLGSTGRNLAGPRLLESILQPSREVAPQFLPWLLALDDGTVRTGLLVREEATGEQTYTDSDGRPFVVRLADVSERRLQSTSIMPDALPHAMTRQEFRDVLAYLRSGAAPATGAAPAADRAPSR